MNKTTLTRTEHTLLRRCASVRAAFARAAGQRNDAQPIVCGRLPENHASVEGAPHVGGRQVDDENTAGATAVAEDSST